MILVLDLEAAAGVGKACAISERNVFQVCNCPEVGTVLRPGGKK